MIKKNKFILLCSIIMTLLYCVPTMAKTTEIDWRTGVSSMRAIELFFGDEYKEPKILYTTTYLNARKYPNTEWGKVVKVLKPNTEVVAVTDFNGWSKIRFLNKETNDYDYLYSWNEYLSEEKAVIKTSNKTSSSNYSNKEYLGNFKLTAYCKCSKCCGKWANSNTASGTIPSQGRTIAMNGIAFGTKLLINGHVYVVEDRGTPYGHVDIYHYSHSDAKAFGRKYTDVYRVW